MLDLIQEFESITSLPDDAKLYVLRLIKEEHFEKNEYLLKSGAICSNLYFVRKGLIYGVYKYRGRNIAMRFAKTHELCFVPESFFKQTPSKETLRAIHDSTVYSLSYDNVQNICRLVPKFHTILDHYFFKDYIEANNCLYMLRSLDGYQRYEWLKEYKPDILSEVQLKKTSSYINLVGTTLGRYIKRDTGQSRKAAS